MDFFNKDILNSISDVPEKVIEIPEWNAKIKVRGITKQMQVKLARIATADDKDAFDYQKALLKASVVEPELDDEMIEAMYEKSALVIDKIFVEIADMNGVTEEVQAEIAEEFQN